MEETNELIQADPIAAIIGCERSNKRHSSGLRAFILVAVSSTMATFCDMLMIELTPLIIPIMSAATIISVAMISNSSILFSARSQVKGLTTALTITKEELKKYKSHKKIIEALKTLDYVYLLQILLTFLIEKETDSEHDNRSDKIHKIMILYQLPIGYTVIIQ